MFKLHNYNIILPKYLEIVKKKGSSFVFSALGGWDKEKIEKSAEKIAVGSEGGQKGRGLGGRNFCPPSLSPFLFSPQFFVPTKLARRLG